MELYVLLPADGAALLQRLAAGHDLRAAAYWYEQTYGEPVDIDDFARTLAELGFLAPAGTPRPVRFQRLGAALFGPLGWCLYAALVLAVLVLLLTRPELRPGYRQLFFTPYVVLIEITAFVGQVPGLVLHESFHALAGRRLGLRSTTRVGRRLYYLVLETSMDGLVGVPRSRRYLPILAGMLADVLWFSLLTLAAAGLGRSGPVGVLGRACLCLASATVLRFVWQFQFYLRTDLYMLLQTLLGVNDLHGAAWFRVRRAGRALRARLTRRPVPAPDAAAWSERDLRHAGWYAPLMLIGYAVVLLTLVFFVLPAGVRMVRIVAARLLSPHGVPAGKVLDAAVFVVLNALEGLVLLAIWSRSRARAAPARPPRPT